MFDSLDVLIGLITVYLTLAFACTAMVEAIAARKNMRGKILEKGLREFLAGDLTEGKPFVDVFLQHSLVSSLCQDKKPLSYIPDNIVGQVVEALVMANGAVTRPKEAADNPPLDAVHNPPLDTDEEVYVKELFGGLLKNVIGEAAVLRTKGSARLLYEGVKNLPGGSENQVKGVLTALLREAGGDPVKFRAAVEEHFNLVMDRASGWFKRHQQLVALVVSATMVSIGNVDTFTIVTSLSQDQSMRESMVSYAGEILKKDESKLADKAPPIVSDNPVKDALGQSAEALIALNQIGRLQFGWTSRDAQVKDKILPAGTSRDTHVSDKSLPAGTIGDTHVSDKNLPAGTIGDTATTVGDAKVKATTVGDAKVKVTTAGDAKVKAPTIVETRVTDVPSGWGWMEKVIGLLITTFAVSLGAPFWFDLLKRFMNVREAGKKPLPKPAEPEVCKPE